MRFDNLKPVAATAGNHASDSALEESNIMARKPKSEFQKESEANSTAVVLAPSLMSQLFTRDDKGKAIDESKVERRNAPAMLKPGDIPVWTPENPVLLQAEIIKIMDSPNSTIKGKLLWLRAPSGHEFTFPCTGVVRNALAPGVKADDKELTTALEKEIGKTLFLKRTPDKTSAKYKKNMFMFDVFTVKP